MAYHGSYPLAAYNYKVTLQEFTFRNPLNKKDFKLSASKPISFSEVSGLTIEYEKVGYGHGLSFAMGGGHIMRGKRSPIHITMKRGIISDDPNMNYLYEWFKQKDRYGSKIGRNINIDLCDPKGKVIITWKVKEAVPLKLDGPSFSASANEVATETVELTARGISIEHH